MALTVAKVNTANTAFVAGDHVVVAADVTGDSSYPTGGWGFTPSALGLSTIDYVHVSPEASGTYIAAYDYANSKLKTFTALGTQTTNATDLHTITWRVLVIGKGFATVPA